MKKILIIEDQLELRENLQEILELSGYEARIAENGKVGIRMLRDEKPDLVICDVMMPELDGFGVLKIVNDDPNLYGIPFIFLTAKTEIEDIRKGMSLGAVDYIVKPFDDTDLLNSIKLRLERSERLQAIPHNEEGLKHFFDEAKAERALTNLSANKEIRIYKKKDAIYSEGQDSKYLYYLKSGQVQIFQTSDTGKKLIVKVFGPGEFMGLSSVINGTSYLESATAMLPTQLMLIPVEDFRLVMFNDRDFAAKFIKILTAQTQELEKQLLDLAFGSVRKKVANALLHLDEISSEGKITIMRDDLAAMAGTAKETVIRTLSDFKIEGLIDTEGNCLVISDRKKMKEWPH